MILVDLSASSSVAVASARAVWVCRYACDVRELLFDLGGGGPRRQGLGLPAELQVVHISRQLGDPGVLTFGLGAQGGVFPSQHVEPLGQAIVLGDRGFIPCDGVVLLVDQGRPGLGGSESTNLGGKAEVAVQDCSPWIGGLAS